MSPVPRIGRQAFVLSATWSVVFAAAMELQINVILQGSWPRFAAAMALYAVIGLGTAYSFPALAQRFKDPGRGYWAALTAHGLFGLLVVEWGFMGHAPGSIPDLTLTVIAQAGMFAWWASIAAMPRLLQDPLSKGLRRGVFVLYGSYALVSTALALRWGLAPVILMMPPVYLLFFWFHARFARALRQAGRPAAGGLAPRRSGAHDHQGKVPGP